MKTAMRHLCAVITFCLLIAEPIHAEDIEVEIWVNDSHPPYTYTENGTLKGIYIEVLKLISDRMKGYVMTFNPAPWQRVKKEVEQGDAFAFAPPYYHGYDWQYVWPYSLPIMEETVVLICRNEVLKTPRPTWPNDYLGLTIGNNTGYDGFGGSKFRQYVGEGKITLQELKTTTQNIITLIKGRSDCYMANRLSYHWASKRLIESGRIKPATQHKVRESLVISSDAVYLGITDRDQGKFPFKRDFLQKFNNELYKMHKSKEILEIAEGRVW